MQKTVTHVRLHHVNLGVPVGGIENEKAFLIHSLGYRPIEVPERLRGRVHWFETEDGTQIHLSEDPNHRPADRAHVALEVNEKLAELETILQQHGYALSASENSGQRIVTLRDPAGNRWELRGHPAEKV